MIRGLEHIAIASPDPPRLAQWYVEHLDFVVNYQSARTFFVKASNGSMLEIITAEGTASAPALKDPGLRHLALTVDDFDAAYARLQAAGVNFITEPAESKGTRTVFFTDPDGNILHLIQRETPLP